MLREQTFDKLYAMKLHGMAQAMEEQLKYPDARNLRESHNIRAYGANGMEHYGFDLVDRGLEMDHNFDASDHWMAYRTKYPIITMSSSSQRAN